VAPSADDHVVLGPGTLGVEHGTETRSSRRRPRITAQHRPPAPDGVFKQSDACRSVTVTSVIMISPPAGNSDSPVYHCNRSVQLNANVNRGNGPNYMATGLTKSRASYASDRPEAAGRTASEPAAKVAVRYVAHCAPHLTRPPSAVSALRRRSSFWRSRSSTGQAPPTRSKSPDRAGACCARWSR